MTITGLFRAAPIVIVYSPWDWLGKPDWWFPVIKISGIMKIHDIPINITIDHDISIFCDNIPHNLWHKMAINHVLFILSTFEATIFHHISIGHIHWNTSTFWCVSLLTTREVRTLSSRVPCAMHRKAGSWAVISWVVIIINYHHWLLVLVWGMIMNYSD